MSAPSVDICICTYRRPYLEQTLASVAAIATNGARIRVIVSDNDTTPSAGSMVAALAADFPFPIHYVHSPASNISIARNACLDAAEADFIAFVDDDELVTEYWLTALLEAAEAEKADVVLGPVEAIYGDDAPQWMVKGDFHSTMPVYVDGQIRTGYTCNALIRWVAPFKSLRFDLALGRSGGEDTQFFYALSGMGGSIAFAPDALVTEIVPPNRAAMGWLVQRRFRAGQTHGTHLSRGLASNVKAAAIAGSKAAFCGGMTLLTLFSPSRWRKNLLRGALHVGVIGGIFGAKQANLYGQPTEGSQSHA